MADLRYEWHDDDWMALRTDCHDQPMSIYELHLGSWRKRSGDEPSDDPTDWYTYDELADLLPDYLTELGVTHVEFLPRKKLRTFGVGDKCVTPAHGFRSIPGTYRRRRPQVAAGCAPCFDYSCLMWVRLGYAYCAPWLGLAVSVGL